MVTVREWLDHGLEFMAFVVCCWVIVAHVRRRRAEAMVLARWGALLGVPRGRRESAFAYRQRLTEAITSIPGSAARRAAPPGAN